MNNLERLPVPRQHPHIEPIAADPDRKSFLFYLFNFIYVGCAGSNAACGFSLIVASRGYSL